MRIREDIENGNFDRKFPQSAAGDYVKAACGPDRSPERTIQARGETNNKAQYDR